MLRIPVFVLLLLSGVIMTAGCSVGFIDRSDDEGGGEAAHEDRGWEKLGERTVDYHGGGDHDTIFVTFLQGRFSRIMLKVEHSDIELYDIEVTFGNGETFSPNITHEFNEGQRSRVIYLPGGERVIHKVDFWYRNLPGGGRAQVELWAK